MGTAFLLNFIRFLLIALQILILARVVMSFVEPTGRSSLAQFVIQATEPILGPVRRLLPQRGMFDFSPLIVLLVIGALVRTLP